MIEHNMFKNTVMASSVEWVTCSKQYTFPKFTLLRREKHKVNQVKTLVIKCVLRDILNGQKVNCSGCQEEDWMLQMHEHVSHCQKGRECHIVKD